MINLTRAKRRKQPERRDESPPPYPPLGIPIRFLMMPVTVLLLLAFASIGGVLAFASEAPQRNKIALVSGGNKGVGKEIARRLGSDPDITCLIACRNVELGEKAAADLRSDVA